MYYFLELQTFAGARMRLSFERCGGALRLVQQQLEGHGRLVIRDLRRYSTFFDSSNPRTCKIWGEDLGVGKIWLDLFPSPVLSTFAWSGLPLPARRSEEAGWTEGAEDSSTHSESLPSRPSPPLGRIPE